MNISDKILGIVGLVIAAFFMWQSMIMEEAFMSDPIGPRVFPQLISGLIAVASLFIIIKSDPDPEWPSWAGLREVLIGLLVFVLYAQFLPMLGFVIATFLASGLLTWRLGGRAVESVLSGLAISVGIYVIFHLVLGLSLAKGPFGF